MRRLLVWTLGGVLALVAIAVAADRIVHGVVERRVTAEVTAAVELSPDAQVRLSGFPFLTQLAGGRLTEVSLEARHAVVDGLELVAVDAVARDVAASDPFDAAFVELTATVPTATLETAVARSRLAELGFQTTIETTADRRLVASTRVLGLQAEVMVRPVPAGRALELEIERIRVAGVSVGVDELPVELPEGIASVTVPLDDLPEGLQVRSATVTSTGLRIVASGSDVVLSSVVP